VRLVFGGRTLLRSALLASAAVLALAPGAGAVTQVTCANLASAMNSASAFEVLQLPPGDCSAAVHLINTQPLTLLGASSGGATVLKQSATDTPIIFSTDDVQLTLKDLTFTEVDGSAAVSLNGPGQVVTITDNTFSNNSDNGWGASLSFQSSGPVTATQPSVISGNTFSHNGAFAGAGIAVLQAPMPLVISNNRFIGNAAKFQGGAIAMTTTGAGTGAVTLTGNIFGGPGTTGNSSEGEGGAVSLSLAHGQSLTISANTFQGNAITDAGAATIDRLGAGLYVATAPDDTSYTVTQSNNTFIGNVIDATQATPTPLLAAGGAGEWVTGVSVKSTADKFIANRISSHDGLPPEGAGLGVLASAPWPTPGGAPAEPGSFTGADDVFRGNSTAVGGWGGAIYVGDPTTICKSSCPASSVALYDSTLIGNSVDAGAGSEGGAIWGEPADHLTLANSIVAGNAPKPELFGFASGGPQISYSDVCNEPGGTPVPAASAHDICATPLLNADGSEKSTSPTINAGSNALIPAGVSTDVIALPRVRPSHFVCNGPQPPAVVDMGAYEFQPLPLPCPHPPPFGVSILSSKLKVKHRHVAVRLLCLGAASYCDGTVAIFTTGKHPHRLGRHHFRIGNGKRAGVAVSVGGFSAPARVTVKVSARDARRHHARSHKTLPVSA
jgi:hypothetical protein